MFMIVTIILGAAVYFGTGMVWYNIFGKAWCDAYNRSMDELKPTPMHFFGATIVALVVAAGLHHLITITGYDSLMDGARLGLITSVAFVATTQFSGVIWAGRPVNGFLIDTGCMVVGFTLAGALMGLLS